MHFIRRTLHLAPFTRAGTRAGTTGAQRGRMLALLLTLTLGASTAGWAAEHGGAQAAKQPAPVADHQLAFSTADQPPTLEPLDVHPRTLLTIVEQLRHNHYLDKKLDDDMSSEIFDNYLNMLDGAHAYFTAADVADLSKKYRYKLDDALVRGDLAPAFDIFNLYEKRLTERLEYLLERLHEGLGELNFDKEESIAVDREDAPWPAGKAAMDDLWRRRLKAAVLAMKLNGKPVDEIQELLTKRYANRLKQAGQAKSEDCFQLYVNAFATTYDPHTQYFSPRTSQNFNINMSLQLEGIGAVLRSDDEYTSVVELVPAGPADKSGLLKPSDRIVSVGQGQDGPLIDVVGWRLDDVVELIRGPKDSTVRLEVIPHTSTDASNTRVLTIKRDAVELEEQAAQKRLLTINQNGQTHKIGIIEVPTFYADFKAIQEGDPNYKSTTRDVRKLIGELKKDGMEALVIDLRNNGGGSLQEADTMTGLFIKSGPTVQVKSANRRPSIYADTDDAVAWDGPMAVLVNRLSASASEIFAGAIQDYQRGLIIGSQTFGKGTVQTLIPLNRGQLKITAAKFYRVSGQSTQHQGVIPDIEFPQLYDPEKIGESSLHDSMPWDMIQPAVYPHSNDIHPLLAQLNALHQKRAAKDPDFQYLQALAAKNREESRETTVSLNEAERTAEQKQDDAWRLSVENKLRTAKGENPVADVDELDKVVEAEEDSKDEDPDKDAMLRESGNILVDYMHLSSQVALAEHRADQDKDIAVQ